nr:MAG TPA: hypothetical protein [Caudoviricetes sp.]
MGRSLQNTPPYRPAHQARKGRPIKAPSSRGLFD